MPGAPDLRALFDQALDLSPIERAKFLREIQFRSPLLYRQLRALMVAHEGPSAFFEAEGGLWSQLTPATLIGRRFGAYVIEEEIGRGGMGAVYRATRADDAFHKTVAIKIISGGAILSDSALDGFRRERQILAQLEHPHIARLLDGGSTDDGLLYLIMEFVDGVTIDRYITKEQLNIEAILKLFLDVASAVSFAHRNLVVHRDLKPSNILVNAAGEVKLLDFGIAKVLRADQAASKTVAVRLTPEFASPEQVRGEAISTSSDVYSLGVVLFYLLTGGKGPYAITSNAVPDLLQAVIDAPCYKASSLAAPSIARKLRGDLDTILGKAMAKETQRRYSTVEQFADDIRRHLAGRAILAKGDDWWYWTGKFLRRNRLAVAAAALVLASIGGGIASTLLQARRVESERQQAIAARLIAENERRTAEQQRAVAIAALNEAQAERRNALEQRMLADSRAIEARRERGRAESERESAIARYRSVRSLATAILNDVNDSLRDLPGSAPARRKAVLAALQHLEGLSERSASDPELTRDVANAYEEMAEIMLSSFDEAREGASLAIPALLKAVRLRTPLLHAEAPVELANSQRLLGNAYLAAAQPQPAITAYTQALAAAKRADLIPAGRRLTAIVHSNLCLARAEIGAVKDAWPDCQASVAAAIEAGPAIDPELREALLLRAWRTARAAQRAEAKELRDSLVSLLDPFDAEGVKLLEELATDPPRDVAAHRLAMKLGVARMREGKRVVALQRFAEAAQDAEAQPEQFAEAALAAMHAVHEVRNGRTRQAMQLREQALGLLAGCTSRGANLLRNDLAAAFTAAETASTPRSHN